MNRTGAICKADDGVLGLKDFDLITPENEEILNQAIEKEVIFAKENKKTNSCQARFKLIATANSKEARIVSNNPDIVNQQIEINKKFFDLIFVIRDIKLNEENNKKIEELNYIKDYLIYAESINVAISDRIKQKMVNSLFELSEKYDEKKFLQKVEPKGLIQLMVRLSKASAQISLKREVLEDDVKEAQRIIARSFFAI